MKKILFTFLLSLFSFKIYALENIKINNEDVIPMFDINTKKYNYFTDSSIVLIKTKNNKNEVITGAGEYLLKDGINKYIINSNIYGDYEINIYKNYKEDKDTLGVLTDLKIKNYDLDFDSDKHEYEIVINNEDHLDIEYELLNDSSYVDVIGNGNFNKDKNEIIINVDNINTYKINVLKTSSVFKRIEVQDTTQEMSVFKKEIVKLIITTISCILVFLMFYFLFIRKPIFHS